MTLDPRLRTELVHDLAAYGVESQAVLDLFASNKEDISTRRALVLALGQFTPEQLSPDQREPIIAALLNDFEHEPDAGLHGAVEWLLRCWGQSAALERVVERLKMDEPTFESQHADDRRHWYVNSRGQTLVLLPPGEFMMGSGTTGEEGSREHKHEQQHRRKIERPFAIAATEVTRQQFLEFVAARRVSDPANEFVTTGDSAQTGIGLFAAVQYCNWLSEIEGIESAQWCYQYDQRSNTVSVKPGFLDLTGYRLPTEAEWEYACRAGTTTTRYFGSSQARLPDYAWFQVNSERRTHPVGYKKPNDFGLFDMLGNASEWCQDLALNYPNEQGPLSTFLETSLVISPNDTRILRGGGWGSIAPFVRSASRTTARPLDLGADFGFRIARTYPKMRK